jgi:hypothetical protein
VSTQSAPSFVQFDYPFVAGKSTKAAAKGLCSGKKKWSAEKQKLFACALRPSSRKKCATMYMFTFLATEKHSLPKEVMYDF